MKSPFLRILLAAALLASAGTALAEPVKVLMQTNRGEITLELYPDKAPKTVENFLRYTDEGFYEGTLFHRVIYGFMIQGGGFDKEYQQKRTHDPIPNEADNGLKNQRGTIAMARTMDPSSATAQFFINHTDNASLDFRSRDVQGWGYCVFGKVVDGMDVVEAIAMSPTGARGPGMQDVPKDPVIIERVSRVTAQQ